jgi:hypothetical protein
MGSSGSISSHCDPKTLAAIDPAFNNAWNALEARDLVGRFTNGRELKTEILPRMASPILTSCGAKFWRASPLA